MLLLPGPLVEEPEVWRGELMGSGAETPLLEDENTEVQLEELWEKPH